MQLRNFLTRLSQWDVLNLPAGSGGDGPYWQGEIRVAKDALFSLEEQLETSRQDRGKLWRLVGEERERIQGLQEQLEAMRLLIARQLIPLDVAATHIAIIRSKGAEYSAAERDNVAAIVESHIKEARAALFSGISNPASKPKEDV